MTENNTENLVQMIDARLYETQGLIEYAGDSEDAEEWLEAIADECDAEVVTGGLMGWGAYTHMIRLASIDRPDDPALYYLVTAETLRQLGLTD